MKSAKNIDQAYEFINFLETPDYSAKLAEGSGYNPVITGADAKLSDAAKKIFQEAFPGDALKNLWPWPVEPTWYAEIRSQYADKFKAA
jgi:spermidine/putrescine transport system substrate-binding protein